MWSQSFIESFLNNQIYIIQIAELESFEQGWKMSQYKMQPHRNENGVIKKNLWIDHKKLLIGCWWYGKSKSHH